jgi:hypothetical protein
MGGRGGLRLPIRTLADLEQKAKTILREGALSERSNVFISFASEDLNDVNLLRGQALNAESELVFNDWSLREPFDSERAEYIRRGIRERIRQSSVTVVYVSEMTHGSKWVDWEIRESVALGKGVVAVHKGDTCPRTLLPALVEIGVRPIPWTHPGLMDAIRNARRERAAD